MQEKRFIKITLNKNTGDEPLSSKSTGYGDYNPVPELFYQVRVCCKGEYRQPINNSAFVDSEVVIFPDILSPLFSNLKSCEEWVKINKYEIGKNVTTFCENIYSTYEITAEITHIAYEVVIGSKDSNRKSHELESFDYKKGHTIACDKEIVVENFTKIANLEQKPLRITLCNPSEDFVKTFITRSPSAAMTCFWKLVAANDMLDKIKAIKIKEIVEYQGDELVVV